MNRDMRIGSVLSAAIVVFTLTSRAIAGEPTPGQIQTAVELLELTGTRKAMEQGFNAGIAPALQQFRNAGVPPEGLKEISDTIQAFFNETFKWDDVKGELAVMYCDEYTEAEMKELIVFYKTPIGQKSVEKMPILMQRGAEWGMKRSTAKSTELQKRLMPVIAKYKAQMKAPPTGLSPGMGAPR